MIRRLLILAALLLLPASASAYWLSTGAGTGSAGTTTLSNPVLTMPATDTDGSITVNWSAAKLGGNAVTGVTYVVQRKLGAGAFAPVAAGPCSGTLTDQTACTDAVTTNGTYTYRIDAAYRSWTAQSDPFPVTETHTAPTVSSVVRADADPSNAASVRWTVTFSDTVTGVNAADFTLSRTGTLPNAAVSGVTGSGKVYTVTAAVGAGATNGTLRLDVADDDSIADSFGSPLGGAGSGNGAYNSGEVYTVDRVAPALQTLQFLDVDADGRVDQVRATFDEQLAASTATAPWTLANVPSNGSLASVSTSGPVATLTLTEGAGAQSTAVGNFTVALAAAAAGVRDPAGNQSSFAARAPADKAGPVITADAITLNRGANQGYLDPLDTISFTFSENLLASTVPTAPALSMTRVGAANASLLIAGLVSVADLGTPTYFTAAGSISFAGTASLTANTVTVTAGPTCSGGCALRRSQATAFAFSFVPAPTVTDAAGNAAAGARAANGYVF